MNELYKYVWDKETGGVLLLPDQEKMSMEARPVYYQELDLLGFDKYYDYPRDDESPIMWAINNKYYYCGEQIAKTNGGSLFTKPELEVLDNVESEKKKLKCINVELMVDKNKTILGINNNKNFAKDKKVTSPDFSVLFFFFIYDINLNPASIASRTIQKTEKKTQIFIKKKAPIPNTEEVKKLDGGSTV